MDGGAFWAAVHGVAERRTWPSDFPFTFHFNALEKEMATHSSVLAWRIPGTGVPGGLPSMGLHRVGHDWSDLAAAAAADHTSSPDTSVHGNSQARILEWVVISISRFLRLTQVWGSLSEQKYTLEDLMTEWSHWLQFSLKTLQCPVRTNGGPICATASWTPTPCLPWGMECCGPVRLRSLPFFPSLLISVSPNPGYSFRDDLLPLEALIHLPQIILSTPSGKISYFTNPFYHLLNMTNWCSRWGLLNGLNNTNHLLST